MHEQIGYIYEHEESTASGIFGPRGLSRATWVERDRRCQGAWCIVVGVEPSGEPAEMAVRLSKAFGSRAEVWLGLQMEHDVAEVEKTAGTIGVTRIMPKKEELVVA